MHANDYLKIIIFNNFRKCRLKCILFIKIYWNLTKRGFANITIWVIKYIATRKFIEMFNRKQINTMNVFSPSSCVLTSRNNVEMKSNDVRIFYVAWSFDYIYQFDIISRTWRNDDGFPVIRIALLFFCIPKNGTVHFRFSETPPQV